MDTTSFNHKISKVKAERRLFLTLSFILAISLILLTLLLCFKKERIVILPSQGPSLWVEEGRVSETYLEQVGAYLSDLFLTRTPSDVDYKNKILLQHVDPSFYHELNKMLFQEKEEITASSKTLLFTTSRAWVDVTCSSYTIEGELTTFIRQAGRDLKVAETSHKRFTFIFSCQRGRLLLKTLQQEQL